MGGTTNNWLADMARFHPAAQAVITEGGVLTYKELNRESLNSAAYFATFGIKKEDNVGIFIRHNYGFYIIVTALWNLGAVPVPLNTKLTEAELIQQIENAGIEFLIVDDYYSDMLSGYLTLQKIVYSNHLKWDDQPAVPIPFNADKPALIMHTSGSSGKPKAVVHTFATLEESVKLTDSIGGIASSDIFLASLPFYHIGGFMMPVRALVKGAAVAFPESLQYEDLCESLLSFNPTAASFVPTTLLRFIENSFPPNKGLKYFFLGGGPSENNIVLSGLSKGWPVIKVYGSTETCSMISALKPEEGKINPSSSGKALTGVELKVENGELFIKSPSLFKEYYRNEEETKRKLQNGFYRTGDFAQVDDKGYLYIEARREDLIITGGENVAPYEVEKALKKNELIEDVCVFPMEDVKWGQKVCAAVKLKENAALTAEDLKEFLSIMLSTYKIPKEFYFVAEIPRNEMGKANRPELIKRISGLERK